MKRKTPKRRVNPAYPQRVARAAKEAQARAPQTGRKGKGVRVKPRAVAMDQRSLREMDDTELKALGFARYGGHVFKARPFQAPALPVGVIPTNARGIAPLPGERRHFGLDSATVQPTYTFANRGAQIGFPGYPYLAELALRSEYRAVAETTAKEMTRRWIKLGSAAAGDKDDKIKQITDCLDKFKVRALWRKAIELDGFFGRAQVFMGIKGQTSDKGRQLPLKYQEETLGKDCLESLAVVEPMWTTPFSYNSTDPTAPDFFRPDSWFILGKKTHATRLLTFISRPVPDIFKPAYNFSGISSSQLMEPYVSQWFRVRDSVSDMLYNYSTSGVATNLASLLEEDDTGLSVHDRAKFFNQVRGNRGLMLIDKETEEFFQFNAPLTGLAELMAHFQEQMASPSKMPLVKLIGRSPGGLNASSEEEVTVYYDHLHSEQEGTPDDNIDILLDVIQSHLFGSIDEDITHEWVPLDEPTVVELATIRKSDAEADAALITNGVILPDESRQRLQNDPNSGYSGLTGPAPEMTPEEELQNTQLEHEGEQGEADREHEDDQGEKTRAHTSEEADREREHGAVQSDKDRQVAKAKAKVSKGTK